MRTLDAVHLKRAGDFVRAKARPVDRALFDFTFEDGRPEAVWEALRGFANDDGGFGHGMEPDCRLPASSVLGTITAFPYLLTTHASADHPLVRNGIQYLINVYDRSLQGWRILPPAANDHPRAGWWNYDPATAEKDVIEHWSNPSACAVAYLHRYRELVPDDFLQFVTDKAMSVLAGAEDSLVGHDYLPFIELAEATPDPVSAAIWSVLKRRARAAIVTDPGQWTGYGIRPLWAVSGPDSPLMEVLTEPVAAHLDFEIARQQSDGSWAPFWSWGRFEAEWEVAKTEWQGQLTVKVLRGLEAFGRMG